MKPYPGKIKANRPGYDVCQHAGVLVRKDVAAERDVGPPRIPRDTGDLRGGRVQATCIQCDVDAEILSYSRLLFSVWGDGP